MLKNYYEFQDNASRALNQEWGPFKVWALCDCIAHTPMKLALIVIIVLHLHLPYTSLEGRERTLSKH